MSHSFGPLVSDHLQGCDPAQQT